MSFIKLPLETSKLNTERLSDLSKATQLKSGISKIWTQSGPTSATWEAPESF